MQEELSAYSMKTSSCLLYKYIYKDIECGCAIVFCLILFELSLSARLLLATVSRWTYVLHDDMHLN